jgi:GTPase SAR1 family protein
LLQEVVATASKFQRTMMRAPNVLLLGTAGAGKTTVLHTLLTLFQGRVHVERMQGEVCHGGMHCTTRVDGHDVRFGGDSGPLITRVLDTWGIEARVGDYQPILGHLIKGEIPLRWDMNKNLLSPEYRDQLVPDPSRRPDVVLFLVEAKDLMSDGAARAGGDQDAQRSRVTELSRLRKLLKDAGVPTVVVPTQLNVRFRNASRLSDVAPADLQRLVKYARNGFNTDHVHPILPYISGGERDPRVEMSALRLVRDALELATARAEPPPTLHTKPPPTTSHTEPPPTNHTEPPSAGHGAPPGPRWNRCVTWWLFLHHSWRGGSESCGCGGSGVWAVKASTVVEVVRIILAAVIGLVMVLAFLWFEARAAPAAERSDPAPERVYWRAY